MAEHTGISMYAKEVLQAESRGYRAGLIRALNAVNGYSMTTTKFDGAKAAEHISRLIYEHEQSAALPGKGSD